MDHRPQLRGGKFWKRRRPKAHEIGGVGVKGVNRFFPLLSNQQAVDDPSGIPVDGVFIALDPFPSGANGIPERVACAANGDVGALASGNGVEDDKSSRLQALFECVKAVGWIRGTHGLRSRLLFPYRHRQVEQSQGTQPVCPRSPNLQTCASASPAQALPFASNRASCPDGREPGGA